MKTNNIFKYSRVFLFAVLLGFFGVMALKGREIHERVCPKVRTDRVRSIMYEGKTYKCIKRECVHDGRAYEIYKQKGFFNENTRVKEVEVETMDNFQNDDMVVIISDISDNGGTYFAVIPDEGLTDGESVVIISTN